MFFRLSKISVLRSCIVSIGARALQHSSRLQCYQINASQDSWKSQNTEEPYKDRFIENGNRFTVRSHCCGQISDQIVGETVNLYGWLEYQRGGKFIVLRDAYGSVQALIKKPKHRKLLKETSFESVIRLSGVVTK